MLLFHDFAPTLRLIFLSCPEEKRFGSEKFNYTPIKCKMTVNLKDNQIALMFHVIKLENIGEDNAQSLFISDTIGLCCLSVLYEHHTNGAEVFVSKL